MARVLHLVPGADPARALTVIRADVEAGDEVTVALLGEPPLDPPLPEAVAVHRVPSQWSYERLLEHVFAADRVVTW